jgi:hypothetical protein
LIYPGSVYYSEEFRKADTDGKISMALVNQKISEPILGGKKLKNVEWITLDPPDWEDSDNLLVFILDKEKGIVYNKFSKKYRFRVEINVYRQEMYLDKKRFINLVELILFLVISASMVVFYLPYLRRFLKFMSEKRDAEDNYNYPYMITNVCCILKLSSIGFYIIQGVYKYLHPLQSSYTKHHLVSFSHFLGCVLSHASGYLFTLLLIFIAQGYTITYLSKE